MTSAGSLNRIFQKLWENELIHDDFQNKMIVLGSWYLPTETDQIPESSASFTNDLRNFFQIRENDSIGFPIRFIEDVETRIWFTYRTGFEPIERDPDGPSPVSIGALFRGAVDFKTSSSGFTSDIGWGCMIRTSQCVLANALLDLSIGRDWRFRNYDRQKQDWQTLKHDEIIESFSDSPDAPFSIHNFVKQGTKKPGEWFGPNDAARSIEILCNDLAKGSPLGVFRVKDSGNFYEDEFFKVAKLTELKENVSDDSSQKFHPTLILAGVRLGIDSVNQAYWDSLKQCLSLKNSVGIAGGRPVSSHYFFGFQGDFLFYLDPHVPQKNLVVQQEPNNVNTSYVSLPCSPIQSVHTTKIQKLHLSQIDPSMLVGFLIKDAQDYEEWKRAMVGFSNRVISISEKAQTSVPNFSSSVFSDDDEFVDLGNLSHVSQGGSREMSQCVSQDMALESESDVSLIEHHRKESQPVLISENDVNGYQDIQRPHAGALTTRSKDDSLVVLPHLNSFKGDCDGNEQVCDET